MSEADLKADILRQASTYLDEKEVWIHDAGVGLADVQTANIARYVIRQAVNVTGRRNYLPPAKDRGRPAQYGEKVRPLPRERLEHLIAATSPDVSTQFQFQGRTIQVQGWQELVRADRKWPMRRKPSPFGPFPTLCIRSQWFWAQTWRPRQRRSFFSTLTAGPLSNRHWSPSKCWDYIVNSFLPRLSSPAARVGVVGG
ncbi:MAG: hypothetical protein IPM39_09690 [Chloroflexi bacterium]|nr:hypothetical protein [Chloroflexota bacterium]